MRRIIDMANSGLVIGAACVAVCSGVGVLPAAAQDSASAAATRQIPRISDGSPNLSGIWQTRQLDINEFTLEREEQTSERRSANPGSGLPYTEAALQRVRELTEADDPMLRCIPRGIPRQVGNPNPFQIVQTPGQVVILYEAEHRFRIIPTDGRPHPADWYPTFMGDSVGEWVDDTLVVDIIGFNDETWLDSLGTFHSENLHVVERYRLSDADTLQYEATVEDRGVLSEPWIKTVALRRRPDDDRIRESICVDTQDYLYFQEVFEGEQN
jgi:hypothetical protein